MGLQKVLADRFQLKFHSEKREISVYAITQPANTKDKLTEAAPGQNLPTLRYPRPGLLPARNATMTELAQSLQGAVLDRPVINQTKIEGRYDFTLGLDSRRVPIRHLGLTAAVAGYRKAKYLPGIPGTTRLETRIH